MLRWSALKANLRRPVFFTAEEKEDYSDEVEAALNHLVDDALANGFPKEKKQRLEEILQSKDVWRTKFRSSDPPAKVEPMVIKMKTGCVPYRCKSRNLNPLEARFLKLFGQMLMDAGVIYQNQNSKYCSPANPVMKPEGKGLDRVTHEWTDEEILKYFRLTIDYRIINLKTEASAGYMPFQAAILERVQKAIVLATFDLIKGFWQMPLEKASQEILSFLLDGKVMTPTRVMQGHCDSALYFQSVMERCLASMMMDNLLVWIDDVLLFAKSVDEYLEKLEMFLALVDKHKLKLNPSKCELWKTEIKWCGRIISGKGVKNDPARIEALTKIPYPTTCGELQQFLCAANWMRTSMPNYSQIVASLTTKLDESMRGRGRKKRVANTIKIELNRTERNAWDALKAALNSAVELEHVDDEATMCLFTDASDEGWSVIVTQVRDYDDSKPPNEQKHKMLICLSGRFKGAQENWSVIEKEAYPIAHACGQLNYLLMRPQGFRMFCDHKNLISVFAPHQEWKSHTRGKLLRWAAIIGEYRYTIEHIAGENNIWADLMSRWGHPPPPSISAKSRTDGNKARVQQLMLQLQDHIDNLDSESEDERTPSFAELYEDNGDDDEMRATVPLAVRVHRRKRKRGHGWSGNSSKRPRQHDLRPLDSEKFIWPTFAEIQGAQRISRETPKGVFDEGNGVYLHDRRLWIPKDQHDLITRICVVAHCGSMGHRGHQAMRGQLQSLFYITNLDDVIKQFLDDCLLCPHVHGGKVISRPYSEQWKARYPNEGIHFDFLYMGDDWEDRCKYVLVLKDDLSHQCELVACEGPTSQVCVDALLAWASRYGLPYVWISDQGTHFKNKVMQALALRLKVEHRFSVAYSPWRNGTVERLNRDLLQVMRILLQEYGLAVEEWPYLLPVVQANLNMTKVRTLKGECPCTVMTGLEPRTPLDVIVGDVAKDLRLNRRVEWDKGSLSTSMYAMKESLKDMHKEIADAREKAYWRREALHTHGETFSAHVGDYVLWSRVDEKRQNKLMVTWIGPYRIKEVLDCSCVIEHLITGECREAHDSRLKPYAESDLNITEEILQHISAQGIVLNIREVDGKRAMSAARINT